MDDMIDESALELMRQRGGHWAAYENVAFDSSNAGHIQFLRFGTGCTYGVPPAQYPFDCAYGMGWRYKFHGVLDVEAGKIIKKEDERAWESINWSDVKEGQLVWLRGTDDGKFRAYGPHTVFDKRTLKLSSGTPSTKDSHFMQYAEDLIVPKGSGQ